MLNKREILARINRQYEQLSGEPEIRSRQLQAAIEVIVDEINQAMQESADQKTPPDVYEEFFESSPDPVCVHGVSGFEDCPECLALQGKGPGKEQQ